MPHPIPAEHAQHDLELIAGHAAGDLTDTDHSRAETLLQSCTTCAELRADLVAIASATRALPAAAGAPRDFRIDAAQAARLRRGGLIKSLLRPFAAPRSTARPVATAFTSLGLAGLLVANILPSLFGSAASLAPVREQTGAGAPAASAASAASEAPIVRPAANGPSATDDDTVFGPASQPTSGPARDGAGAGSKSGGSASPAAEYAAGEARTPSSADTSGERLNAQYGTASELNLLSIGSILLLVLGVALFGLVFLARRVR